MDFIIEVGLNLQELRLHIHKNRKAIFFLFILLTFIIHRHYIIVF